ncbi:MAG: class I SAM-dependent methyltransferase [Candidatus Micrarchaeota archaeon]
MSRKTKIAQSFDKISRTYEDVRPTYPDVVIKKILSFSKIPKNGKIVEVGCGPGIATIPFAKKGYNISAIDPGKNLLSIAKEKTRKFSNVSYILSSFEDAKLPINTFDLLISGTAFHWVNQKTGYKKAGELLKKGGTIALFWLANNYKRTDFIPGLSAVFKKYSKNKKIKQKPYEKEFKRIARSGLFGKVHRFIYNQRIKYSKEDYIKLVSTFGWINVHPKKPEFLKDLSNLLGKRKYILVPYSTILFIARRK